MDEARSFYHDKRRQIRLRRRASSVRAAKPPLFGLERRLVFWNSMFVPIILEHYRKNYNQETLASNDKFFEEKSNAPPFRTK
jgi:hypothetical protein